VAIVATTADPDTGRDTGARTDELSAMMSAPLDPVWRRRRYVWAIAGIWLFYLWQPVVEAWRTPSAVNRVLSLLAITAFAATFIYSFAKARSLRRVGDEVPTRSAIALTATAFLLTVLLTVELGPRGLSVLVYVGVMAIFLLPARWGQLVVLGLVVGSYLTDRLWPGAPTDFSVQFSILVAALAMWGVMQLIRRNTQLAAARSEITRLAIAEERSRFARDLHDILGHSLTVVAVKAELAGRLVRLDPDRAEGEIGDVERLAREALHDVRTALSGYRDVTLIGEVANARSALAAAGIEAELPHALDDVPAERRELFGWVLREAVTNVVRHSGASRCRVQVTATEIRITDDGRGPLNGSPVDGGRPGVGLVGLRERVDAAGATLTVDRAAEGGFELRVSV
jgi:two-component system sensor histidine kinase DesK